MEVARTGLGEDPPVEPPRVVRPLLRFRRLSASALDAVQRALEEDEAFRLRVVAALDEAAERRVGEAGRLFLVRPEGWASGLEQLEVEAAADADAAADRADERTARKRLRLVEDEARRLEDLTASLRAQLGEVRAELVEERRGRQQAVAEAAALAARVDGLERERDAAHRRASALATEVAQLQRELAVAAEAAREAGDAEAARSEVEAPSVAAPAQDEPEVVAPSDSADQPEGVAVSEAAGANGSFDVGDVRAAIADAAAAAAALGRSLAAAARALGDEGAEAATSTGSTPRPTPRTAATHRHRAPAGRLPVALPPGVFDDDPAAADHLVRVRGCVLVVDGYNASLRRWPQLPIAEQRRRLVDAAAGLAARCGPDVHIVFDGDDDREHGRALARRGVHVRFSAREVEADAVILDQVDRLPATRPVVVATDDRRVRREAAARGANVITQDQLFSLV